MQRVLTAALDRVSRGDSMHVCRALALLLIITLPLAGCATGYTRDGREVRGLLWGDDGHFVAAAQDAGGLIGGLAGGPVGSIVGTAVAGTLAAAVAGVAGLRRGERRGWEENDEYHARTDRDARGRDAGSTVDRGGA